MKSLLLFLSLSASPDGQWHRYFAWYPVEVDAYDVSEIVNGKMRYPVWLRFVDTRFDSWIDDDDDQTVIKVWKYRIAR